MTSLDQTPSFNIELVNNNNDEDDEDEKSNSLDDLANDEEMRVCSMEEFPMENPRVFLSSVIMSRRMNFVEYLLLLNVIILKMILILIVNNLLSIKKRLNNVNV